ncbi:MAG: hypothetical protein QXN24_04820 [Candidatus Bathyarchaeia archaeon]
MKGDICFLASPEIPLLKRFYTECRLNLLRPAVLFEYLREPYIYPVCNVRVTFDFNLRTSITTRPLRFFEKDIPVITVGGDKTVIMEVKYDDFIPDPIWKLLSEEVGLRQALGKFALCRETKGVLIF